MSAYPLPPNPGDEAERLAVLASLDLLDTPPEPEFDSLIAIAREMLDCPIALVSLVDAERQWFKARCGLDAAETPREHAFCAHAVAADAMLIVPDATLDARFADNPLVRGAPHIRFYAGMPLHAAPAGGSGSAAIGTLCVIDTRPRTLDAAQVATLGRLAALAETLIRGRTHVRHALRHAEEHRRQHDQLQRAERIAEMGSWRMSLADESLVWSDQVFAIFGLPVGAPPPLAAALDHYPIAARAAMTGAIARTLETGEPFDVELDLKPAMGPLKRVRSMGELEIGDDGPVALIGVIQDITARHAMEQALRRTARHDELTGIANRAGFNAELDRRIIRARGRDGTLALILIDLDGFKTVNDQHGHAAGDAVLKAVAGRLQAPELGGCYAARLGGDEFAVIVSRERDCARVGALAQALLAAMRAPIALAGGAATIGGTIGVAWLEDGMAAAELYHAADLALYAGKRAGKGVARFAEAAAPPRQLSSSAASRS